MDPNNEINENEIESLSQDETAADSVADDDQGQSARVPVQNTAKQDKPKQQRSPAQIAALKKATAVRAANMKAMYAEKKQKDAAKAETMRLEEAKRVLEAAKAERKAKREAKQTTSQKKAPVVAKAKAKPKPKKVLPVVQSSESEYSESDDGYAYQPPAYGGIFG